MTDPKTRRVPEVEIRETPSPRMPSVPRTPRGYKGDPDAHLYAGPTKRSADVNDFVTLEAEMSKANERESNARSLLDASRRECLALSGKVAALEAALDLSLEDAEAYAAIRDEALRLKKDAQAGSESSGGAVYYSTPVATVEAVRVWRETAISIADKVVEAIRGSR